MKSWLHKYLCNKNIQIPTKEEYKRKLILKVNSKKIIATRIYQFQIKKSTKYI